jgi:hypothetical protein
VFESLGKLLEGQLKLKINQTKSAADFVNRRKFLGIKLQTKTDGTTKIRLAETSEERFKARMRELTNRNWGISFEERIKRINEYVRGWMAYFRMVETPSKWPLLQGWILRRLRCCQLNQWKRGRTRARNLRRLGVSAQSAQKIAGSRRGLWHLALTTQLHVALGHAYWRRLGLVYLEDLAVKTS